MVEKVNFDIAIRQLKDYTDTLVGWKQIDINEIIRGLRSRLSRDGDVTVIKDLANWQDKYGQGAIIKSGNAQYSVFVTDDKDVVYIDRYVRNTKGEMGLDITCMVDNGIGYMGQKTSPHYYASQNLASGVLHADNELLAKPLIGLTGKVCPIVDGFLSSASILTPKGKMGLGI